MLAAAVAAFAAILVSVTFRLFDMDFWQHLAVGKAVWSLGAVPTTQIWAWPTYGSADVYATWGFEAMIWPVWSSLGETGLTLWRWGTTLAAFALLWAVARRLGARGFTPLVVLAVCALVYRERVQIRPETLVAVLLALELWILEGVRRRVAAGAAPGLAPFALVPIAWVWINVHISWFLGFLLVGIFALDLLRATRVPKTRAAGVAALRALLIAGGLAAAVLFANPFGVRAVWQPFEYFLAGRQELIYRTIYELRPIDWSLNVRNLLPLLMVAWPLLIAWRWRRRGLDVAELLIAIVFTVLALRGVRFIGFYALFAAPYVARALDEWVRSRAWPEWTRPAWARAGLAAVAAFVVGIPEWTRADVKPGTGIEYGNVPVAAADFMARHDVRGRGFNLFELGGYLLFRFWPERDRLPFMDVHQAGTREDRDLYARSPASLEAWQRLDAKHRFDWALLAPPEGRVGTRVEVDRRVDFLDADTTWALVLFDDASRLYVRRTGAMAPVAEAHGARILRGGFAALSTAVEFARGQPEFREALLGELREQTERSPRNASVFATMALIALQAGDAARAREYLATALRVRPDLPGAGALLERIAQLEAAPPPARAP